MQIRPLLGRYALFAATFGIPFGTSHAQQEGTAGAVAGRVVAGPSATAVAGAEVLLPSLDRHTLTDSLGAFRFDSLPTGLHAISIRKLGFANRDDTLRVAAGPTTIRTFTLEPLPPTLETVHTMAGKQHYVSPALQGFEERRLAHQGGHFISDSTLRQNESTTLARVISSRIPGVMLELGPGGFGRVLVSRRKRCRGLVFMGGGNCHAGGAPDCYVAVYLDGAMFFNSKMAESGAQPPNFEHDFNVANLAGVEYYASSTGAPASMHGDDDGCGSLWLWTRER